AAPFIGGLIDPAFGRSRPDIVENTIPPVGTTIQPVYDVLNGGDDTYHAAYQVS
ncbi:hypothetical protein MBANPS3_010476, partial [Mucor bainieri]